MTQSWQLWAVLSAVFSALVAVWGKLGVEGLDTRLVTAIRTTVVLVMAWGVLWAFGGADKLREVPARGWFFLVLSGLATGLAWLCYYHALILGDASQVAPVDKLSVVLAMAMAFVFLGEKITPAKLAGGALILAGVLVLAWPSPAPGPAAGEAGGPGRQSAPPGGEPAAGGRPKGNG